MPTIREDAQTIIQHAIAAVLPEQAVKATLAELPVNGKITLIAIGKAAWRMAQAAHESLADQIQNGIVITKYGHALGQIPGLDIYEAAHPLPDQAGLDATERAINMVKPLTEQDTVLLLVSGGGSALFEQPATGVTLADLMAVNEQLLKSGADIVEINTVRKHLSQVKGGRLAQLAHPAKVIALLLSDVLGDRLDSIASGPAYPDSTTSAEALNVVERYRLALPQTVLQALQAETPKSIENVESFLVGSVELVCQAAAAKADKLGYQPTILTTTLDCEAREAGRFLAALARYHHAAASKPLALILGGETVVNVIGEGLGGRNQELALAAALGIRGLNNVVIAAIGTDGTDGPTDAAGGIVDGHTVSRLTEQAVDATTFLHNNDAYHALAASGDLLKTGPTGTNVNDLAFVLID